MAGSVKLKIKVYNSSNSVIFIGKLNLSFKPGYNEIIVNDTDLLYLCKKDLTVIASNESELLRIKARCKYLTIKVEKDTEVDEDKAFVEQPEESNEVETTAEPSEESEVSTESETSDNTSSNESEVENEETHESEE